MSPGKNDVAKGPQPLLTKTWAASQRRKAKTGNSPQDRQIRRINPGVFVRKCLGSTHWDFRSASNSVSIHTLLIFEFNYYHRKGFTLFLSCKSTPFPTLLIYCFLPNTDSPPSSSVKGTALMCYSGCPLSALAWVLACGWMHFFIWNPLPSDSCA